MLVAPLFDNPTKSSGGFLYRYILPRMKPPPLIGIFAQNPFFSKFVNNEDLIVGSGHGSPESYTAQNERDIFTAGSYDPSQTEGKIIKLVSCDTGQLLGPDLVQYGKAKAALCYDQDLLWLGDPMYDAVPWSCALAQPVMLSVVAGINSLLDGATAGESLAVEKAGYLKGMEDADSELQFSILKWNYDHSVLFGDQNAKLSKSAPNVQFPFPPPPLFF